MRHVTGTTIGEIYDPAMEITDPEEAESYFRELVEQGLENRANRGDPVSWDEMVRIQKSNLGYYSGYYGHETMERVERLFGACHPIFGSQIAHQTTPEEAFLMGIKAAATEVKNG
jgi:hypothetical protein